MKIVKIPAHQDLFNQVGDTVDKNGLIAIAGQNQNRIAYVSLELLNFIRQRTPSKAIVSIGEPDQYTPDWMQTANPKNITSDNIVFAGAIRDEQKAASVLSMAETCTVLCILHASDVEQRFEEMGIKKSRLLNILKFVFETEA